MTKHHDHDGWTLFVHPATILWTHPLPRAAPPTSERRRFPPGPVALIRLLLSARAAPGGLDLRRRP